MNNKTIKQYPYFLFWLWLDALIFLFAFHFLAIGLFFIDNQPVGTIFGTLMLVFSIKSTQLTLRNLYRSLAKKPAIEITEQYFVNHMNNTKIHWKNIDKTERASGRSYSLIKFTLRNRKSYVEQIKEPMRKISYLLEPKGKSVRVILNYIQGKNEKIYDEIEHFRTKKSNYY